MRVPTLGRFSVIQDPEGGVIRLWWRHSEFSGMSYDWGPGGLRSADLYATDLERMGSFYGELFGWTLRGPSDFSAPPQFHAGHRRVGTLRAAPAPRPEGLPDLSAYWLPTFMVGYTERAMQQVGEMGGNIVDGPRPEPNGGQTTVFADGEGAIFATFAETHMRDYRGEHAGTLGRIQREPFSPDLQRDDDANERGRRDASDDEEGGRR
jgi:predicted enzyme related to lactoylglutathione lyase